MTTAGFELAAGDAMAADLKCLPASFLYRDVTRGSQGDTARDTGPLVRRALSLSTTSM